MSDDILIKLSYTLEEWELLKKKANNKGAKCFRDHFVSRLHGITKSYTPGNSLILSTKKQMTQRIPADLFIVLKELALLRQTSVPAIIDWLVAEPLLREHYDENIFKQPKR